MSPAALGGKRFPSQTPRASCPPATFSTEGPHLFHADRTCGGRLSVHRGQPGVAALPCLLLLPALPSASLKVDRPHQSDSLRMTAASNGASKEQDRPSDQPHTWPAALQTWIFLSVAWMGQGDRHCSWLMKLFLKLHLSGAEVLLHSRAGHSNYKTQREKHRLDPHTHSRE